MKNLDLLIGGLFFVIGAMIVVSVITSQHANELRESKAKAVTRQELRATAPLQYK